AGEPVVEIVMPTISPITRLTRARPLGVRSQLGCGIHQLTPPSPLPLPGQAGGGCFARWTTVADFLKSTRSLEASASQSLGIGARRSFWPADSKQSQPEASVRSS